jgi:hypothetical protein
VEHLERLAIMMLERLDSLQIHLNEILALVLAARVDWDRLWLSLGVRLRLLELLIRTGFGPDFAHQNLRGCIPAPPIEWLFDAHLSVLASLPLMTVVSHLFPLELLVSPQVQILNVLEEKRIFREFLFPADKIDKWEYRHPLVCICSHRHKQVCHL